MAEWGKDEAWKVFLQATKAVKADQPAKLQAFDKAWEHGLRKSAERPAWEAWIRRVATATKAQAKINPGGFLITVCGRGPDRDLNDPEEAETPRAVDIHQENSDHLQQLKRERTQLPANSPPMWAGMQAIREGRHPTEIYNAWLEQGAPPAGDFVYPALTGANDDVEHDQAGA